jgi:transposase
MAMYDAHFKLSAVKRCLSGKGGTALIAAELQIDRSMLRWWVSRYQTYGRAGLVKKVSQYDARFKLEVLRRAERERLSYREVAVLYDIRSAGSIGRWRALYDEGGMGALEPKPKGKRRATMPQKPPPKPVNDLTLEELQKELAYLRAENDYLKKMKALIEAEKTKALAGKRK